MTTEEKILNMLDERGLSLEEAKKILAISKVRFAESNFNISWESSADGYPEQFYSVVWVSIKRDALKWIDDNIPKAWFRSMFI